MENLISDDLFPQIDNKLRNLIYNMLLGIEQKEDYTIDESQETQITNTAYELSELIIEILYNPPN